MYDVKVDKDNELVMTKLGGMMTPEEVGDYIADIRSAFVAHQLSSYVMIIDVSDCPIQAQDMTKAMAEYMVSMPKARRIAVVTGSSLAKMQVRRLFTQPYARTAQTLEEGRAWVLGGIEPAGGKLVPTMLDQTAKR